MLPRLVLAAFLLGHAAIHAGYLSPRPVATIGGPPWPFDLTHSWVLSPLGVAPETLRVLGFGLFALTLAAFALAAVAAVGFLPGRGVGRVDRRRRGGIAGDVDRLLSSMVSRRRRDRPSRALDRARDRLDTDRHADHLTRGDREPAPIQ